MKPQTSQIKQVERHLKKRKSITTWDAIQLYGITRLSALIFTLREDGYNIESKRIDDKNSRKWWTKYSLKK
jgi:hypothetical protein